MQPSWTGLMTSRTPCMISRTTYAPGSSRSTPLRPRLNRSASSLGPCSIDGMGNEASMKPPLSMLSRSWSATHGRLPTTGPVRQRTPSDGGCLAELPKLRRQPGYGIRGSLVSTTVRALRSTRRPHIEIEVLKLVPFFFVISTPGFDLAQRGQQRLLDRVFSSLLDVAKRRPASTPPGLVAILNSLDREPAMEGMREANPLALPARAVCDYLCTLTEQQVVELDRRLNGTAESMLYGTWLP